MNIINTLLIVFALYSYEPCKATFKKLRVDNNNEGYVRSTEPKIIHNDVQKPTSGVFTPSGEFPTLHYTDNKPKEFLTDDCPEDYCWEDRMCVKRTPVATTLNCAVGYTETASGDCVKYSEPMTKCPQGCTKGRSKCICATQEDKTALCPMGTEPDGNECVVRFTKAPTCPAGTAEHHGQCAEFVPKTFRCEEGYVKRGTLCVRECTTTLVPLCPPTMALESGVCRSSLATVQPLCPRGAVDLGDRCAVYSDQVPVCEEGFSMHGTTCRKLEFADKLVSCPNGGLPSEGCEIVLSAPMSPYCEQGALVNGACQIKSKIPVSFDCPSGYRMQGNTCVTDVDYDCSVTDWQVECEEPKICDEFVQDKCVPLCSAARQTECLPECASAVSVDCVVVTIIAALNPRQLHAGSKHVGTKHAARGVEVGHSHTKTYKINYKDPAPVCQTVPISHFKSCTKSISAQPAPLCEAGIYKGGSTCEVTDTIAAMVRCDGEVDAHGNCIMTSRAPAVSECPGSFTPSGGRCSRTNTQKVQWVCPVDSENEINCPVYYPKSCQGGDCVKMHHQNPGWVCPEGFTKRKETVKFQPHYNHELHEVQKDMGRKLNAHKQYQHTTTNFKKTVEPKSSDCVKLEYGHMVEGCPEGTDIQNAYSCVKYQPMVTEERVVQVAAQMVCPEGWSDQDRFCLKEDFVEFEASCPTDTYFRDGFCARTCEKREGCPQGSQSDNGMCYVVSKIAPLKVMTVASAGAKHTSSTSTFHN